MALPLTDRREELSGQFVRRQLVIVVAAARVAAPPRDEAGLSFAIASGGPRIRPQAQDAP
jgi:hypothetical protein